MSELTGEAPPRLFVAGNLIQGYVDSRAGYRTYRPVLNLYEKLYAYIGGESVLRNLTISPSFSGGNELDLSSSVHLYSLQNNPTTTGAGVPYATGFHSFFNMWAAHPIGKTGGYLQAPPSVNFDTFIGAFNPVSGSGGNAGNRFIGVYCPASYYTSTAFPYGLVGDYPPCPYGSLNGVLLTDRSYVFDTLQWTPTLLSAPPAPTPASLPPDSGCDFGTLVRVCSRVKATLALTLRLDATYTVPGGGPLLVLLTWVKVSYLNSTQPETSVGPGFGGGPGNPQINWDPYGDQQNSTTPISAPVSTSALLPNSIQAVFPVTNFAAVGDTAQLYWETEIPLFCGGEGYVLMMSFSTATLAPLSASTGRYTPTGGNTPLFLNRANSNMTAKPVATVMFNVCRFTQHLGPLSLAKMKADSAWLINTGRNPVDAASDPQSMLLYNWAWGTNGGADPRLQQEEIPPVLD